jgi:hypothetical protein
MQCNINAKGKAIRLIYGIVFVISAIVLALVWAMPSGQWFAWALVIGLLGGGAFAIFEGAKGWCVIRAMGFKTPI